MNCNEICGFTPHFGRQHRDFIKIMIKCEAFNQLIEFNKTNSFYPNHSQRMTNSGPERRKPEVSTITSLSTHKKSKEEDSIGVLTVPNDLKRNRRSWTKELVKNN